MKVLVISHTYISKINRDKWKVLAEQNPEITLSVIFPTQWPSCLFTHEINEQELEQEQSKNCFFHPLPAHNVGNEVRYFYHTKKLLLLLKSFKPDLVHVEQGATALSFAQVIACCKLLGLKSQFTFFTWINWRHKKKLTDHLLWNFIQRWNMSYSAGAFVGNQEAEKILRENEFKKPVLVLPQLGVDLETFYPAQEALNSVTKYVGYVGRLVPEKGVHLLLQAFAHVAQKFPDWELVFVGKGPERGGLEQAIKKNKLDYRVTIIESIPHHEIAKLMRSFSLFVLPSYDTAEWKEQFGHVLIEAMACKVPILASNAGEIPNVVSDAGLIFEQKNFDDLCSRLSLLMQNATLRSSLALAGQQRVQQCYTHQAIAHQTNLFWKTIINQNKFS